MCAWCLQRSEKALKPLDLKLWIRDSHHEVPVEEQLLLLTTELDLHPLTISLTFVLIEGRGLYNPERTFT